MRHLPEPRTPRWIKRYRVRFVASDTNTYTGTPGETTSKPLVERGLRAISNKREAWMEVKATRDGPWEKLDA